ncbi:MAG: T9SS type A sorting domain-containing protein [Chitinophagales bacterium]
MKKKILVFNLSLIMTLFVLSTPSLFSSNICDNTNPSTLPYYCDFSFGLENWTIVNPTPYTWTHNTFGFCDGASTLITNNDIESVGTNSNLEQYFDLSNSNNTQLTFDVAHAVYDANYPDELRVNITTCDEMTTNVYAKAGSELATTAPVTGSYIPQSCEEWRTENIDLSAFDGQIIKISFENIRGYYNFIHIDEINIGNTTTPQCGDLSTSDLSSNISNTNGLVVTLNWPNVPNAEAYKLAGRKQGGATKYFPETQQNSRTFTEGILYNTTYQWSVKVKCDGVWTGYALFPAYFTTPSGKNQANSYDIFANDATAKTFSFDMYPNPAKRNIYINLENQEDIFNEKTNEYKLQISDINGKVALEQNSKSFSHSIDVSHLNTGTYFVSIQNNESKIIEKLIIY